MRSRTNCSSVTRMHQKHNEMQELLARIDKLIGANRLPWARHGEVVEVELGNSQRKQCIRLDRRNDRYLFSSTVVGASFVMQTDAGWRNLAYKVWRKNASKDLVAFGFDSGDRLVGQIEQPARTLDDNELRMYIEVLARECDRFEYLLRGSDIS